MKGILSDLWWGMFQEHRTAQIHVDNWGVWPEDEGNGNLLGRENRDLGERHNKIIITPKRQRLIKMKVKRRLQSDNDSGISKHRLQRQSDSASNIETTDETTDNRDCLCLRHLPILSDNLFHSRMEPNLMIEVGHSSKELQWTNEILEAMAVEEELPENAEVILIQQSVRRILSKGSAAAKGCSNGIYLSNEVILPKVASKWTTDSSGAHVNFPLKGVPDFSICLNDAEFKHPECYYCSKVPIPSLPEGDAVFESTFVFALSVDQFLLKLQEPCAGPITPPGSVIQASTYILYSMLRVLPHLSDAEKRVFFGEELCAYTMVLTHKACILIKISWDQFHQSGRFAMQWSRVLKGREMAGTIARYIWWAKCLLVRALPYKTALTSAPQYTWMPLSEYALRFPNEIGGENTGKTITSHQSLTNPVLRVGERIYRMFNHYLCNTNGSQVLSLFRELRANDEKRGRELAEKRSELAEKRAELAERRAELETNGGDTLMLTAEEKSVVDESSAIKDILAELVVKASELARNTADIEAELSHVKNEIKQLDVPPPYTNPLIDWVFRAPFISMPFYGPTLYDVLKDTTATPHLVKSLFQSLMKSSLLALENASFAHMDIRTTNICLRDSPKTWNNAILIDFDFCADYSNADSNRMQTAIAQYPPEIQAHAKSDVWMLGYLLLRLGMCGSGWEDLTQKQIEDWSGEKVARQEKSEDDDTRGKFVGALHLAEKCLKVDPGSRISISEIAQHVDTWEV